MKKITITIDLKSVLLGLMIGLFFFSAVGFQNIDEEVVFEDCEYRYQAVPFGESGLMYYDTKTGNYSIGGLTISGYTWNNSGTFDNAFEEGRLKLIERKERKMKKKN